MKYILVILTLFIGLLAKAQQAELLNETWLLDKVVIGSTEYLTPNNSEITQVDARFTNSLFETSTSCNGLQADTSYTNNDFDFLAQSLTLGECSLEENINFENIYFGTFFTNSTGNFHTSYQYLIENLGTSFRLTLTNPNSEQAIYTRANLSLHEAKEDNLI